MDSNTNNFDSPLHQKRLLAFINHFLIKNVQFLNNFSQQCEQKLVKFESKMNTIEASLTILESQLNSIPNVNIVNPPPPPLHEDVEKESEEPVEKMDIQSEDQAEAATTPRDPVYEKFFKMIHVGVPLEAVKLKVLQEGLDPTVLDQR